MENEREEVWYQTWLVLISVIIMTTTSISSDWGKEQQSFITQNNCDWWINKSNSYKNVKKSRVIWSYCHTVNHLLYWHYQEKVPYGRIERLKKNGIPLPRNIFKSSEDESVLQNGATYIRKVIFINQNNKIIHNKCNTVY
jgi:hypothetical protein